MKQPEVQAERRGANRAKMPAVASMVDEMRALFPGLKVVHATENGLEVGKRDRDENAFTIPPNYCKPAGGWK